jgi:hypothetical protein
MYLNIIKAIYDKLAASIIWSGEKWNHKGVRSSQIPSQNKNARERNKRDSIGKKVKWFLFVGNTILHLSGRKYSTKKLLYLVNTCRNIAGYKINIQNSVAFLYNNEQTKK